MSQGLSIKILDDHAENFWNNYFLFQVTEYVKKGHFQIACGRYFDHLHNSVEAETTINHPNQFFDLGQINPNEESK